MLSKLSVFNWLRLSGGPLLLVLLMTACVTPPARTPSAQKTVPASSAAPATSEMLPARTPTLPPTLAPSATPEAKAGQGTPLLFSLNGVAQGATAQVIPAVSASESRPNWEVLPQHIVLTLVNYPVRGHRFQAQIYVYPLNELKTTNPAAGEVAANLQALLASRQEGKVLPFLPLYNAAQVLRAQVKYLDFKSGKGVRYLTQYQQAPLPINNQMLIYTFQGLSQDGKYYIAAVFPVTLAGLPADDKISEKDLSGFFNEHQKYLADMAAQLNQQAVGAFSPDLSKLDGLLQSIEVK